MRVVKFNDYQCPACRQTWLLYHGIIAKYEAAYPGAFVYESRDFPLEGECGAGGSHGMACEAAAAVRMARAKNKHRDSKRGSSTNQSFEMTRDDVKRGLREVAQITDFDEQYPKVIDDVRADAQLGQKLGREQHAHLLRQRHQAGHPAADVLRRDDPARAEEGGVTVRVRLKPAHVESPSRT